MANEEGPEHMPDCIYCGHKYARCQDEHFNKVVVERPTDAECEYCRHDNDACRRECYGLDAVAGYQQGSNNLDDLDVSVGAHQGIVASFSTKTQYGFIIGKDGSDIFFHFRECDDGAMPQRGDVVFYNFVPSLVRPGHMVAINVTGGTGEVKRNSSPRGPFLGTIRFFVADKGYGFITGVDGEDIIVHISECVDGATPQRNDIITFDLKVSADDPMHRMAVNVTGGSGFRGLTPSKRFKRAKPIVVKASQLVLADRIYCGRIAT